MYGQIRKIGILGGSFNPVHNGHLMIAQAAQNAFGLDPVLFVPNPDPPHKAAQMMPSGEIRTQMTAKAIAGIRGFALSTYELHRAHDCYTCNTLAHFREKYPEDELYFIMGADSLAAFDTWRNPALIASLAVLCVACRDDVEQDALAELADQTAKRYHADIRLIPCAGMDLSSTRIRELVYSGQPFRDLVPPGVAEMIYMNGLYRPDPDAADVPQETPGI